MNIPGYEYITHELINRSWGPEVRFTVKDGNDFIDDVVSIKNINITEEEIIEYISGYLATRKIYTDRIKLTCKFFDDIGPEVKQALFWVIRKIRQYPNATLLQAQNAWNSEWADSIFTFDKLVIYFRTRVGNITWDEFKTYVINHIFEGID